MGITGALTRQPPAPSLWGLDGVRLLISDLPDLALWLKADALALNNLDPIDTWTPSGGTGGDATATGTDRPVYRTNIRNGLPVVRFAAASSQWLQVADHADLEMQADSTVIAVIKRNTGAARSILAKDSGAASAGAYHWYSAAAIDRPVLDRPFVEGGVAATTGWGNGVFVVASVVILGALVSHYTDGGANGTDTIANGTATNQVLRIGTVSAGSMGTFFDGDIGELVICKSALDATLRNQAEKALGAKWAIPISS